MSFDRRLFVVALVSLVCPFLLCGTSVGQIQLGPGSGPGGAILWKITSPVNATAVTIAGTTTPIDIKGTWPAGVRGKYILLKSPPDTVGPTTGTTDDAYATRPGSASEGFLQRYHPTPGTRFAAPAGGWKGGVYTAESGEFVDVPVTIIDPLGNVTQGTAREYLAPKDSVQILVN